MKKQILLLTATVGLGYLALTSYKIGPGLFPDSGNRTGAKASTSDCGGSGCHGGNSSSITAAINVDSAGAVSVMQYVAGMTYTVTVTGKHATLPKFGFQFAAVSGTGSSQAQAGSFSGLPSDVAEHTFSALKLIEQSNSISATSPADSFTKSFTWTAPAAGTGTVTMYLTVNGVNGDGSAGSSDLSGNTSITLSEYTPTSNVSSFNSEVTISAYPNPVSSELNIRIAEAVNDNYDVKVYDMAGRTLYNGPTSAGVLSLNTSTWSSGIYNVVVANESAAKTMRIVK